MEVVASLSQDRTAAAHCGLFTHKSVPVIFEPPCILCPRRKSRTHKAMTLNPGCFTILNTAKDASVISGGGGRRPPTESSRNSDVS